MSEYIGEAGKRLTLRLTLKNEYTYTDYAFSYYGTEKYIYTFEDADGNVFVWKTGSLLGYDYEVTVETKKGTRSDIRFDGVRKGDSAEIKATVKDHSEYKGTKQTVLTRVKVISIDHIPTKEEVDKKQAEDQKASLKGGDFIWSRMPYRQYKEHYADCETIKGSFRYENTRPYIDVIIREGRLKASGTRGEHYKGYEFLSPDETMRMCFRAVSEENAKKQLLKEKPEATDWECVKIYDYAFLGGHKVW